MIQTILIVDDDFYSREYLKLLLVSDGHEVQEAEDGETALSLMRQSPPSLVLLDIVMPGLDGLAVCARMKDDPALKDIPVVFLSVKGETQDKIAGLDAGGADYVAKPFDPGEVLARVRTQLRIQSLTEEIRRTNVELRSKQARIDEDLKAAGHIQQSLLPNRKAGPGPVNIAWKFKPSFNIGGDIFNLVELPDRRLGFYILDVSGHGVPSALVAVSAFQALQPHAGIVLDPSSSGGGAPPVPPSTVLSRLDEQFPMQKYDQFFTMFYMVVDTATGRVAYSSAGHPPAVLLKRNGGLTMLDKGGAVIGLGVPVPFEEGEVVLESGDVVVLYTDGVTDYENSRGEPYGETRFFDSLRDLAGKQLDEVIEGAWSSLQQFGGGAEPIDDISLFGLALTGM